MFPPFALYLSPKIKASPAYNPYSVLRYFSEIFSITLNAVIKSKSKAASPLPFSRNSC
jgi:hypothetical protein